MTAKAKIKVIKKGEVRNAEKPVKEEKTNPKATARDMVSNVTNWVNDFQQRRRDETKQAIEKFFSQTPQASNV
jgi:formylglycine-generating enzyme required for sulfatase activity